MAYSQQRGYRMRQMGSENYAANPINNKPHVVGPKGGNIPSARNDIVLKQYQAPPHNTHNNPNGYYPHQQPSRRPHYGNGPPPVTASHQKHIKQNKPQRNNRESSSDEDFVEDELDANGQVVIIASDHTNSHHSSLNSIPTYASNEPIATQPYYQEYQQAPNNNNYNNHQTYNHNAHNQYVPPYAYNHINGYVNNNYHAWQAPPPLPKHKMENYSTTATSYNAPPAQQIDHTGSVANANANARNQANTMSPIHKLSVASSAQFATSFEQFDDNILDDDNGDAPEFAPIHYDQRFSSGTSNLLKSRYHQPTAEEAAASAAAQHNTSLSESNSMQHLADQRLSEQDPQQRRRSSKKKKAIRPRYKHANAEENKAQQEEKESNNNSNNNSKMNITITKSTTDSFIEHKPSTPSKSSRNDGSETRESDADLEILARDKDYRPSIVDDLQHEDNRLNVTIDRFGFPMDEEMDEKEHRKQVKKENARLMKWQDMIFSKKSGGVSAEEQNETDMQIAHWNHVKNHRKLKARIRKGIPQQLRGTVWQNLSGARERRKIECARYGSKNLYNDLRGRKKSRYHDQIWKDINRTYRKNLAYGASQLANASNNQNRNGGSSSTQKFFKNVLLDPQKILTPQDLEKNATPAQVALYNVLKGFSLYRRDIGYCQGMQAVTALLLMYMTEEEAFWVLASLADDTKYQMDNLWRPNMPAIQLRFYQMERLVKLSLPKLSQHFEKCCITSASMYQASQWFITIFLATDMKFFTITRVWDIYLNEGLKTVFRMGVGFLKYFEKQLLKSDFEEMLELFRTGGSQIDVDEYVKVCFSMRITHAQLAVFEKDFNRQQQQIKAAQQNHLK